MSFFFDGSSKTGTFFLNPPPVTGTWSLTFVETRGALANTVFSISLPSVLQVSPESAGLEYQSEA